MYNVYYKYGIFIRRIAVRVAKKQTKKTSRARVTAVSGKHLVKELNPAGTDSKYFGSEPNYSEIQPNEDNRQSHLIQAFNWYSRFFTSKDAKEFIVAYLNSKNEKQTAKLVKKVSDSEIVNAHGWLARLSLRGLVLNDSETERLATGISRLVESVKSQVEETPEKEAPARPNIQDIMRERASDAGGVIEGLYDEYYEAGYSKDFDTRESVITALEERKILPQHVSALIKTWESKRDELIELQSDKCDQLAEGYSHMTKMQVRYAIKFIESVISDLHGYVALKQTAKKPRARKPVPVEKIVAKLKYCKEFNADGLDLISVSPTKLHGSSEAWVYDTKKRKMHHYVADEYSKTLIVKGNTLLGFDKTESGIKTLRKPAEQLKELTGSKPKARKYFKNIKAVQAIPTGRFNENMVILKAF